MARRPRGVRQAVIRGVPGSGFRVQSSGFRVQDSGFSVQARHLPSGLAMSTDCCVVPCLGRWPSRKWSYERPTRGIVCGTMRSMCCADAGCLAIDYQFLWAGGSHTPRSAPTGRSSADLASFVGVGFRPARTHPAPSLDSRDAVWSRETCSLTTQGSGFRVRGRRLRRATYPPDIRCQLIADSCRVWAGGSQIPRSAKPLSHTAPAPVTLI